MAICYSSGIGKTKTYSPGFRLGLGEFRGVFYLRFEGNLKFLSIEKNFLYNFFFRNQKNNMIFMIRSDKIAGN